VDFGPRQAKRVDQVTDQELLGIDVMEGTGQGPVLEDMPLAPPAELTTAEGHPPLEHPIGQAVAGEKASSAVLDQARSGPGPHGAFVKAFEYLAVDPGPNQHVRGEQARGPSPDDRHGTPSALVRARTIALTPPP
jgi:hypothetical protein